MKTWRCEKSHLLMLIYNVYIIRFNVTFFIQDMWVILGATYMYARMVTKRFFWLYILFMRLQSFGFNLFGSKSETLPKTVSHHAVFCLFFLLQWNQGKLAVTTEPYWKRYWHLGENYKIWASNLEENTAKMKQIKRLFRQVFMLEMFKSCEMCICM